MDKVRTTCSLCEACCGAVMTVEDGKITKVMADREDPLSGGFICAKGAAIPELEADPDRLHSPMMKKDGKFVPVSWDEAFAYVDERMNAIINEHGRQAVCFYGGNAAAHHLGMVAYLPELIKGYATTNIFTAGSLDQVPRQAVSGFLYGYESSVSVPDIDRADLIWIMGANPAESNGSLMVAPGFLGRMQKMQQRDGRIVVFDPRLTMTAQRADEHVAIRPSGDAAFLAGVAHHLFETGPKQSRALEYSDGLEEVQKWLEPFSPEAVADLAGIDAGTIRRLADELREAEGSAVYGRMGTTTQRFSSLTCWLIDLVNILSGGLDQIGGAMFPKPLLVQPNTHGVPAQGMGYFHGRWRTRISNAPETLGTMPMVCFAEEIETPGEGQVRAMLSVAGNPLISSPDAKRLRAAFEKLEFIVSLDIYINETSSMADVILPSPPRLTQQNYDHFLYRFAVRSYGRFTQAYRPLKDNERSDREIMLTLAAIGRGLGWDYDIDQLDADALRALVTMSCNTPGSAIHQRDPDEILDQMAHLSPQERRMDFELRTGPFGDAFGTRQGITFQTLLDNPQGLDCGALVERLPEMLRTKSGKIELAHGIFENELNRLAEDLGADRARYVLIGRRQLRSNNSWFHNLKRLAHPTRECTAQMNSEDAAQIGVENGDLVTLSTSKSEISLPAEVSDRIAKGVISVPHGWGHAGLEGQMDIAAENPGENVNFLMDYEDYDPLTWTARLNGMPIDVRKASAG